jgi:hypothetical protein
VPGLVVVVALALTLAAFPSASKVELRSSQLDMIPKHDPIVRRWIDFTEDFDVLADLFVVVRGGRKLDRAKAFARDLEAALSRHPEYVRETAYRLDPALYENQGLYFLPLTKLREMVRDVREQRPALEQLSRAPGFVGLTSVFLDELRRDTDVEPEQIRGFFRFIRDTCARLRTTVQGQSAPDLAWEDFFGMAESEDKSDPFAEGGWKLSLQKDAILIAITPTSGSDEFEFIVPFYETCRAAIDELKKKYPELEIGLTGQPAMAYSQQDVVGQDLRRTGLLSLVGVSLVFVLGFKGVGLPLLAMVCLVLAISWTFGLIYFSPGHLNLITTAFVSMLMGLGIDYGIYITSQFSERRRAGLSLEDSVGATIRLAGPGILTGGFTSAVGFLALMMTDFTGFRELGQIAAMGLLLCMAVMLLVLPSLLMLAGSRVRSLGTGGSGGVERVLERVAMVSSRNPTLVLLTFGVLSLVLGIEGLGIDFDYNLLNMEPEQTEAVIYEGVMQRDFEITPDTLMVLAGSMEEAFRKKHLLEKLSSVGDVDSLTNYVPEHAPQKLKLLQALGTYLSELDFGPVVPTEHGQLAMNLDDLAKELRDTKLPLLVSGNPDLVLAASQAQAAAHEAATAVSRVPEERWLAPLREYEREQFDALSRGWEDFRKMLAAQPFSIDKLPYSLRDRYRGKSGRVALFVSAAVDVRLENQAKLFIHQVSSVDTEATGVPILVDKVMQLLRTGFHQATAYSLLVVALLVLLDFRSLRETFLALTPLAVSLAVTMGLMRIAGIQYNPANFVSLPVMIGLGMAYGVYLLHRLKQEPEAGPIGAVRNTGKSILLSCATSVVGFGSLMVAGNRGLSSLGWILVVGLLSSLVTAFVLLPVLAEVIGYGEATLRQRLSRLKEELLSFRL